MGLGAFILVVVMGGFGQAETCGSKDLRSELGPPRDQGETGWCFSHTTADLISQRTGMRVSAFDVATTFILGNPDELSLKSSPELQSYLAANPGFASALRKARSAEPENYGARQILTDSGMYNTGGEEDMAAIMANTKGLCLESDLSSNEKRFETHLRSIRRAHRKSPVAPYCDTQNPFGADLSAIAEGNARVAAMTFQKWVDNKCKRVPSPVPLIPDATRGAENSAKWDELKAKDPSAHGRQQKELREALDRALDQGRAVAIGYNAYDIEARTPGENDIHGDHSSIIAARKMIGGKCHYFLRNSRGSKCDGYIRSLRTACEKQAGGLWLTLDQIPSFYSAISLR